MVTNLLLATVLLGATDSVPCAKKAADPASISLDAAEARRYSLSISGGISLGAYEAGFTWALVNALVQDTNAGISAVTGASAGGINALIAAVEWVAPPAAIDPTENLYYDAWVPVGLGELLPAKQSEYGPDDGLMTRKAFDDVIERLRRLEGTACRADRQMPMALTVTREAPASFEYGAYSAPFDRFVGAVLIHCSNGGLAFTAAEYDKDAAGEYLALHSGVDRVIELLQATSAFPFAFSGQKLPLRAHPSLPEGAPDKAASSLEQYFFDGGVFDNVPVALAIRMSDPNAIGGCEYAAPCTTVIAVVPGDLRGHKQEHVDPSVPLPRGMGRLWSFVGNFVTVARRYEDQALLRNRRGTYDDSPDPFPIRISQRFFPVYGERHGAFGGFFMRSFRHYDFGVGIYEGAAFAARELCFNGDTAPIPSPSADDPGAFQTAEKRFESLECFARKMYGAHEALNLRNTPKKPLKDSKQGLRYLYRELLYRELREYAGTDPDAERLKDVLVGPGLTLRDAIAPAKHEKDDPVLALLLEDATAVVASGHNARLEDTTATMRRLGEIDGFGERFPSDADAAHSPISWAEIQGGRALRRLRVMAIDDARKPGVDELVRKDRKNEARVGVFAEYVFRSALTDQRSGADPGGSARRDDGYFAAAFTRWAMPNTLAFSRHHLHIDHRPAYFLGRGKIGLGLQSSFEAPYPEQKEGYPASFDAGPALFLRPQIRYAPSISLGAYATDRHWHAFPDEEKFRELGVGARLGTYWFWEKVRVTVEIDDFDPWNQKRGYPNVRGTVGFSDLNGLTYWAFQGPNFYKWPTRLKERWFPPSDGANATGGGR